MHEASLALHHSISLRRAGFKFAPSTSRSMVANSQHADGEFIFLHKQTICIHRRCCSSLQKTSIALSFSYSELFSSFYRILATVLVSVAAPRPRYSSLRTHYSCPVCWCAA
jgi:hypothetical protein